MGMKLAFLPDKRNILFFTRNKNLIKLKFVFARKNVGLPLVEEQNSVEIIGT
jgi:hypothetical protein